MSGTVAASDEDMVQPVSAQQTSTEQSTDDLFKQVYGNKIPTMEAMVEIAQYVQQVRKEDEDRQAITRKQVEDELASLAKEYPEFEGRTTEYKNAMSSPRDANEFIRHLVSCSKSCLQRVENGNNNHKRSKISSSVPITTTIQPSSVGGTMQSKFSGRW